MNRLFVAFALFVCWSDAAAAVACRSSPGTDDYYQYRLIDGKKCWYRGHTKLEKSALAWKSENRRPPVLLVPRGSIPALPPVATAAGRPDEPTSGELARATDSALRPAPDFDSVFAHFPASAAARPVVHLLYPPRVSQAWGSKRVAVVVYRREP